MADIVFTPANEMPDGTQFSMPLDLNVTLDYQIHLINNCIEWCEKLEAQQSYKLIPRIENTIKRALVQIAHLQQQIKIETLIDDEEDTEEGFTERQSNPN